MTPNKANTRTGSFLTVCLTPNIAWCGVLSHHPKRSLITQQEQCPAPSTPIPPEGWSSCHIGFARTCLISSAWDALHSSGAWRETWNLLSSPWEKASLLSVTIHMLNPVLSCISLHCHECLWDTTQNNLIGLIWSPFLLSREAKTNTLQLFPMDRFGLLGWLDQLISCNQITGVPFYEDNILSWFKGLSISTLV